MKGVRYMIAQKGEFKQRPEGNEGEVIVYLGEEYSKQGEEQERGP